MFKKLSRGVFLVLICGLGSSTEVFAHAVVTESSLRGEPLAPGKANRVMLIFNSGVEISLSKFDLVRKGDSHEAIEFSHGSKPGQIIVQVPALNPGKYALHYKVFAADGHLTEDIIRFSVAASPE